MCGELVSCAEFRAILTPFSEVIRKLTPPQVRHTFEVGELYFKGDSYLHNFFYDRLFSHTILYIHKLSHTPRILSLGRLWAHVKIGV